MGKDLFDEDKTDEKSDESGPENIGLFDGEVDADQKTDKIVNEPLSGEYELMFKDEDALDETKTNSATGEDESWIPLASEKKGSSGKEERIFEEDEEEIALDNAIEITGKTEETIEFNKPFEEIEQVESHSEENQNKAGIKIHEDFENTSVRNVQEDKGPGEERFIPIAQDEIESPHEQEKPTAAQQVVADEDPMPTDDDFREFADLMNEEPEAPPWEEVVEIPAHGEGDDFRKKKSFVFFSFLLIVGLIAVAFVYLFLETGSMPVKIGKGAGDKPQTLVIGNMEEKPIKAIEQAPAEAPPTVAGPAPEQVQKVNSAPIITGTPVTSIVEGASFSFTPQATDPDPGDKLMFFVTNQPAWMKFDTSTGALTGTPGHADIGVYKDIVILVSDNNATASLPAFDLTVESSKVEAPQARKPEIQQNKTQTGQAPAKEKDIIKADEKKEVKSKEAQAPRYLIPDLMDMIRKSEFKNAAKAYKDGIKQYSNAYTLKIEVVCLDESVQLAFEKGNFDRRMFILPRQIKERPCFAVFWGIYSTKKEALEAIQSIPAFFAHQAMKPQLVLIKQYL
ncbi:hypothetical protein PITCH_A980025 [uncultured Desulfobacterium sp.]|uniref:SPOR domain-containing protein n=1 Tax=uncultured Desulfobacterium sp. TaxID=201089 RepID=A0A445N488_9BACT|nr:hypothetical protein PITCH_A980025 [uncultured Desulfobacterium sp.]